MNNLGPCSVFLFPSLTNYFRGKGVEKGLRLSGRGQNRRGQINKKTESLTPPTKVVHISGVLSAERVFF